MSETDLFQEPSDVTLLDPALRGDLIQTWVTTRADLNEAEEENILKGAAGPPAARRSGGAARRRLLEEPAQAHVRRDVEGRGSTVRTN